ncbi:Hypothetical protein ACI5QL_03478 [Bacillus velezensis]|uniref:Uncharacterized protein n=1 Tax=Bacillus amyloliquefaciens (strain Y2) TaxID=1155777 RepID=I2CA98_BACAY|nr:hypothetical protein MUS_3706 [Bacillus velezensis YAU B9601-Y2]
MSIYHIFKPAEMLFRENLAVIRSNKKNFAGQYGLISAYTTFIYNMDKL